MAEAIRSRLDEHAQAVRESKVVRHGVLSGAGARVGPPRHVHGEWSDVRWCSRAAITLARRRGCA